MKKRVSKYLLLVGLHVALAFLSFYISFFSFIYSLLILVVGVIYIAKNKDKNNEALYFAAYFVGLEILLRMTKGLPLYEIGKYAVILFMIQGMFYKSIKKQSGYYFVYIILLVPSIILAINDLGHDMNIRKAIAFNLSGPVCLGISAMYCAQREITIDKLINILFVMGLPIISITTYIFLYSPDLSEVVINTTSNSAASGGFGPNQVSTVLGLGMFVFFVQLLLNSKNKLVLIINILLLVLITFRGIVTFSRGGVITALIIIGIFVLVLFLSVNKRNKSKLVLTLVIGTIMGVGVWTYSSLQTGGMIENRYRNEDALGRKKESVLTGRDKLIKSELQMFYENPIFGVGVGRNKEIREDETGISIPTHSEVSRILAEHGMLGVIGLLILIFVPLSTFYSNRENIFLLSFFFFWALTINHAAMRIAAPAFVYALSLLKVTFNENPPLYRE